MKLTYYVIIRRFLALNVLHGIVVMCWYKTPVEFVTTNSENRPIPLLLLPFPILTLALVSDWCPSITASAWNSLLLQTSRSMLYYSLPPASSQRLRSNRSTFISDPVVSTSSIELPHSTVEDIVLQWGDTGFLISSSDFIDKLKVHSAPIQRPRYIYTALQTMQFVDFYSYSSTSKNGI